MGRFPERFHYRNKMEYSFAAIGRSLGDDPDAEFEDGFFLGFKARERVGRREPRRGQRTLRPGLRGPGQGHPRMVRSLRTSPWHAPKREGFFASSSCGGA